MSASDVIAAVALAISLASAVAAGISLLLGFRESGRRDEELGFLRREAEHREEEVSLLRQQVAAQNEELRRAQQADIAVGDQVPTAGSPRGIEYTVTVQNIGVAPAVQVGVQMVDPTDFQVGPTARVDRALVPGEAATVKVMTPPREFYTGPYTIFVAWHDGRGYNRKSSGVTVGAPS